jgi:cobalt-zinc-cadmium resistance protein CzcA
MKEGSVVARITACPTSRSTSPADGAGGDEAVMEVPGVKSAVSRIGRGESPADPAGAERVDAIVSLKPRDEWPEGWTQDDIAGRMREKLARHARRADRDGAADLRPRRRDGDRRASDVAVKIFGYDLTSCALGGANRASPQGAGRPGFRIERVTGQQYLTIEIDRPTIARHGINVADVRLIEIAIGGRHATDIFEGERRFPAVVRLPQRIPRQHRSHRNILVTSPHGARVPLRESRAHRCASTVRRRSRAKPASAASSSASTSPAATSAASSPNCRQHRRRGADAGRLHLEWGGQFQNMEKRDGPPALIVPITIAAIFFLLFLLFRSLRYAALIITVLPFASIGGVVGCS